MRAGYGEPLRAFLATHTVAETVLDFGHAPVFEDADTFPVILSLRVPGRRGRGGGEGRLHGPGRDGPEGTAPRGAAGAVRGRGGVPRPVVPVLG